MTKAKFRVIPAQGQHPTPLTIGIPQIDLCEKSMGANNYTFQVNDRNKISVHLTPFIDSDPNIHIIGPFVKGNSRKWTSSKVGSDSIVIIPTQEELGGIFTIVVSSQNTSYYTLLVIDEAQTTVFPPQPQHPTQILSGFQIQQQTETGSEYYYILHVPPDLVSDIVVTVSPLYGDVDLYVNRQQNGFYYTNSTSPQSNTAVWSSEQSFGPDSIVINHQDPNYLSTGGLYYITVRAISNSQFILRGYSADTIITLTEGIYIFFLLFQFYYIRNSFD